MKRFKVIAFMMGAILLSPNAAIANTLVSTSPIPGAALESAPSAITITTEVPLMGEGNEITVTDPTGARVDDGAITVDGPSAVIGLKPLVKVGVYTVNYSLLGVFGIRWSLKRAPSRIFMCPTSIALAVH